MEEAGVGVDLRGRLDGVLVRAVAAVGVAAEAGADDRARSVASGLYHAASACLLAAEGAMLGDARRTVLAGLVVRHKLTPRDPLGAEGEDDGLDRAAADLLLP